MSSIVIAGGKLSSVLRALTHAAVGEKVVSTAMNDTAAAADFDPQYWNWGVSDTKPRMLHAMIRVRDLDASLRFYIEGFGMTLLNRFDVPARRVSAAYLGYGSYDQGGLLELTSMWDETIIVPGSFHFAVGAPDVDAMLARLKGAGARVDMAPTMLVPGGPQVAFITDIDGYAVELIQTSRGSPS